MNIITRSFKVGCRLRCVDSQCFGKFPISYWDGNGSGHSIVSIFRMSRIIGGQLVAYKYDPIVLLAAEIKEEIDKKIMEKLMDSSNYLYSVYAPITNA